MLKFREASFHSQNNLFVYSLQVLMSSQKGTNNMLSFRSCTLTNTEKNSQNTLQPDYFDDRIGGTSRAYSRTSRQSCVISQELVFKRKKQQTEQLMLRYQQQKKCIRQLQDYIEELESNSKQQQEKIQRLQLTIQLLSDKLDKKRNKEGGVSLTFGDLQNKKLKKSLVNELKEKELSLQLQLQTQKYEQMRSMFESKLKNVENLWKIEEKKLQHKIKQVQEANKQLIKQNLEMSKKYNQREELQEIKFRKSTNVSNELRASKQNIYSSSSDIYKRQAERLTDQLKKVKKENSKLTKTLQSRELDLQFSRKQLERKDKKMSDIKQTSQMQKFELEKQKDQLKVKLQQQEQQYHNVKSELEELRHEHEQCLKKEHKQMQNWQESRKLKAMIRERSNAEFAKMEKIFDGLEFIYEQ